MLKNSYIILIPSLSRGGAESMAYQYGEYLESEGHQVKFLLIEDRVDEKYSNVDIVKCISASLSKSIFRLMKLDFPKDTIFISLIPIYTFCFILSRILRLEFKTKLIYTVHNNVTKDFGASKLGKLLQYFYLKLLRSSRNVYSVSEALNKKISQLGVSSKLLPNKINQTFMPVKREKQEKLTILMIGRIDYQKDYSMALEFFKGLNNLNIEFVVDIYGEGPEINAVQSLLNEFNLAECVTLRGYNGNITKVLEDSKYDILLLTSRYEGFGLVIVEAISKCIFPIVRDCDYGPKEIIESGVGFLLPFHFSERDIKNAIDSFDVWGSDSQENKLNKCKSVHIKYTEGSIEQWKNLTQLQ